MRPMPIRYVRDVEKALAFYEALGLVSAFRSRPTRRGTTRWVELVGDGGGLALHGYEGEPLGRTAGWIDLSFEAREPLEAVVRRLRAAGYEPETSIVDESFGRSFTVRDPEGLLLQVNENDRELME